MPRRLSGDRSGFVASREWETGKTFWCVRRDTEYSVGLLGEREGGGGGAGGRQAEGAQARMNDA